MTVHGPVATKYTVSLLTLEHRESRHYQLYVEWRGDDRCTFAKLTVEHEYS